MVKKQYVILMVAGPIFLGYAMQIVQGQWTLSALDGYLVFYAFSLAFALFIFGQKVEVKSVRKNLQWRKSFDRVSSHAFRIILILSVVFFVFWALVLWAKYASFSLNFFDAGIYSDIAFNSSQGRILFSSQHNMNALGEHFSPIMLAFVPFFWINPNVQWLLTAQAAAFAICPVILFFISRELIKNERLADLIALAAMVLWFAFPTLLNAIERGFHPSTLSQPFILLGFLMLIKNRLGVFWVIMVALLLFKENLSLIWVSFGLYSLFALRRKTLGITLILLGGFWGIAVAKWVIPFFREGEWQHTDRLGPTQFIYLKLKYLWLYLFLPLGFLSLANWRSSLMIWPPILLNLAVKYPRQFEGFHHYDDIIVPVLFLAAISAIAVKKNYPLGKRLKLLNAKYLTCWFVIPLAFAVIFPAGHLIKNYPNEIHRSVAQELDWVQERWPGKTIHVRSNFRMALDPHKETKSLRGSFNGDWRNRKFDSGDLIIIGPSQKWMKAKDLYRKDHPGALKIPESNLAGKFKLLDGPLNYLIVYEAL